MWDGFLDLREQVISLTDTREYHVIQSLLNGDLHIKEHIEDDIDKNR